MGAGQCGEETGSALLGWTGSDRGLGRIARRRSSTASMGAAKIEATRSLNVVEDEELGVTLAAAVG